MTSEKPTSLSKNCKQCGEEFHIPYPEVCGSGSTGTLRRVFCSDKCKNKYGRLKTDGKVERICHECGKVFLSFPSQLRAYCSRLCKHTAACGDKIARIQVPCPNCGALFGRLPGKTYPKFCKPECWLDTASSTRITKNCLTCSKPFTVKKSHSFRERCSRKCVYIAQSSGALKVHTNGRTGYRSDLNDGNYYKSALEADFARLMNHWHIPFEYEKHTYVTETGAYTPDFFLPAAELFVELKGVADSGTGNGFEIKMTKNLVKQVFVRRAHDIITVTQKQFIEWLKDANLWQTIPILEQRSYRTTKGLVTTHADQKHTTKEIASTNPTS